MPDHDIAALPRRLDAYLAAAGVSDGVATIDGAPATASQLVYPGEVVEVCLLYTSPSPRDKRQSRMPSSA